MAVKVKDVMGLDMFDNIKLIAGEEGLNRSINRVSVFDCPIGNDVIDKNIIAKGDFFVSSLFVIKDNPDEINKLIKVLIGSRSSGICVVAEYLSNFPEETIELANDNSFPIFLADKDIPYADIIKGITELIIKDKEDIIYEMKIDKILKSGKDKEIVELAYNINSNFMQNLIVFNLTNCDIGSSADYICQTINSRNMWSALKYKDGILIIITNDEKDQIKNQINYILDLVQDTCDDYVIGISNYHKDLKYIKKAIIEATTSCEFSNILNNNIVNYAELELYSILVPMKQGVELREFYNRKIIPIKEYDKDYNMNLFETAVCFIECDGNYEEAAKKMFLHENTIRYRIVKIKQILNMEDLNIEFLTQLSIAVKIHKLLHEI